MIKMKPLVEQKSEEMTKIKDIGSISAEEGARLVDTSDNGLSSIALVKGVLGAVAPSDENRAVEEETKISRYGIMNCPRCRGVGVERGGGVGPGAKNGHICRSCVQYWNRALPQSAPQEDIVALSRDSGIDAWKQLPGETHWEYLMWTRYRDVYYDGVTRMTHEELAKTYLYTVGVVERVASRWMWQVRIQRYLRHIEIETLQRRKKEIVDMTQDHIEMARALREKLKGAIEGLEPGDLRATDINGLFKTMTEIERKAMLEIEKQESDYIEVLSDPEGVGLKKHETEQTDLAEVVNILLQAGALGSVTTVTAKEVERSVEVALPTHGASAAGGRAQPSVKELASSYTGKGGWPPPPGYIDALVAARHAELAAAQEQEQEQEQDTSDDYSDGDNDE